MNKTFESKLEMSKLEDYPSFIESKGRPYAEERRRLYHLRHTHPTFREKLAKNLLW